MLNVENLFPEISKSEGYLELTKIFQTLNYLGATSTFEQSGYVATIGDVRLMSSFNGSGINTAEATAANSVSTIGTNVSKTVIGSTINLTATTTNTLFGTLTQLQTNLIVIGRDSGARITIPITIIKQQ
jgi:hypothetical protein